MKSRNDQFEKDWGRSVYCDSNKLQWVKAYDAFRGMKIDDKEMNERFVVMLWVGFNHFIDRDLKPHWTQFPPYHDSSIDLPEFYFTKDKYSSECFQEVQRM